MMIKVHVFWSDDEFNPSVFLTDVDGAFNLWFALIGNPTLVKPLSKPIAIKVELFDIVTNTKLDPKKGIQFCLAQTYKRR